MDNAALTAWLLDIADLPHTPDGIGQGEVGQDATSEIDWPLLIDPGDFC